MSSNRSSIQGKAKPRTVKLIALLTVMTLCALLFIRINCAEAKVTFKAQKGGTYDGMPLFDGNPDHLDAYLEVYTDYLGVDGVAAYALGLKGDIKLTSGKNKGKTVPGTELFNDRVQGVSTDFPANISVGQTWNKSLAKQIGTVIGNEQLNTQDLKKAISQYNSLACTAISDIRINPLDGRFDEIYSEDPVLTSYLNTSVAAGASGIEEKGNTDNFWIKCIVTTKHYPAYNAEWFRLGHSVDSSVRSLMEYGTASFDRAIKSGAVTGVMTSYGRTNGIPNSISPLLNRITQLTPYGVYTTPDYTSDTQLSLPGILSNGYDKSYTPTSELATVLMILSGDGSAVNNYTTNSSNKEALVKTLVDAVNKGIYGITYKQVRKVAEAQLVPLIRTGVFNERDSKGMPINYPFTNGTKGKSVNNYTTAENQATALKAAQEGIVLLKNDNNILPIKKDSKISLNGIFADARFKTTYAVGTTPPIANAGLTVKTALETLASDKKKVSCSEDGSIVVFKSVKTGKYLMVSDKKDGDFIFADGNAFNKAAQFEVFSWGQGAYSYKSVKNGKWLNLVTEAKEKKGKSVNVPIAIKNNGTQQLNVESKNTASNSYNTTMPFTFRKLFNEDGTVSLVLKAYPGKFFWGEDNYYSDGRYLSVGSSNKLTFTNTFKNKANAKAMLTASEQFTMETVKATGSASVSDKTVKGSQYAIVVVGVPTRLSNGEGADRKDLYLGEEQYQLIRNVSDAYPGKTIVIVESSCPVILEEVQNNKNVAAIVYQSYGGQYAGYALAQLLYGDTSPTGRLTTTWYADMKALPKIDSYSIPEGKNAEMTLDSVDPLYSVDMEAVDPVTTKLSYMYTKADVTYEFGYGLSYSNFQYSNLYVSGPDKNGKYNVKVDLLNTGSIDTSEVVQLYVRNKDAGYGNASPLKKLVSFEKVPVKAGETITAVLTVDSNDLKVFDVNSLKTVVESGDYEFLVGHSSKDIRLTTTVKVKGNTITPLNAFKTPINVSDHSFVTSQVTYREVSKVITDEGLIKGKTVGGYYAVMSKEKGSWTALYHADLDNATGIALSAASTAASPAIEIRLDSPDGKKVATLEFKPTKAVSYSLPGGITGKELGYTNVTAKFDTKLSGCHNLYLVFKSAEVRVNTLQLIKTQ